MDRHDAITAPSGRPIYKEVKRKMLAALAASEWKPGEAVPAEPKLAERFGIAIGTLRKAIDELVEMAGKPAWDWSSAPKTDALIARVNALAEADMRAAYALRNKQQRVTRIGEIEKTTIARIVEDAFAPGAAITADAADGRLVFSAVPARAE